MYHTGGIYHVMLRGINRQDILVIKEPSPDLSSVDYSVTVKVTGKDTGKDTRAANRPDIYVLKLINTVGDKTLTVKDMMERIGLKGSDNFRKKYLNPAIEGGYMALLYPENKTNKGQAYYLTELGKQLIKK